MKNPKLLLKIVSRAYNKYTKYTKAMFVSRKTLSGKPFSKLFCVCLSLGKLVNGKHFPVNGKHFLVNRKYIPVNGKHFPVNFSQRKI